MKRLVIFLLASAVGHIDAQARMRLEDSSYRVRSRGSYAGTISMSLAARDDQFLMNNTATGMIKLPNRPREEFKASAKHVFDKSWNWKSSEIKTPLSDEPVKITVDGGQVKLETNFRKRKSFQSFEYKGQVLPRRAFYTYLQSLPPQPVLEHKDIYLFNEMTLSVHKVSWAYLGVERTIKGPVKKYEIRGLDTVVSVDSKGNIIRVREIDAGIELVR